MNIIKFQFHTDIIVNNLVHDYNFISGDSIGADFIFSITKWLRNNPITKYPLINGYDFFYDFIIKAILRNSNSWLDRLNLSDEFLYSISLLDPEYCYNRIDSLGEEGIKGILRSPEYVLRYAEYLSANLPDSVGLDERRWKEGESVILLSPKYSYQYIRDVIYKYLIKNNSEDKAVQILENEYGQFLKVILTDSDSGIGYIKNIIYPKLLKDNIKVTLLKIRDRFKKFEKVVLNSLNQDNYIYTGELLWYITNILLIPNIRVENSITNHKVREKYIRIVIDYYFDIYKKGSKKDLAEDFIRNSILTNDHSDWMKDYIKKETKENILSGMKGRNYY